jgi:hypothetical protein
MIHELRIYTGLPGIRSNRPLTCPWIPRDRLPSRRPLCWLSRNRSAHCRRAGAPDLRPDFCYRGMWVLSSGIVA